MPSTKLAIAIEKYLLRMFSGPRIDWGWMEESRNGWLQCCAARGCSVNVSPGEGAQGLDAAASLTRS
jgi:hypothetical protein